MRHFMHAVASSIEITVREFGWPFFIWGLSIAVAATVFLFHSLAAGRPSDRLGVALGCFIAAGFVVVLALGALGMH